MSITRHVPILWLTLRQFRAGRATLLVALFAATPVLFAAIFRWSSETADAAEFLTTLFLEILAPTILPLATLILATNALGNEMADRTLVYIVLKPVARGRLIVEKFIASALVTGLAFAVGLVATWVIASGGSGSERVLGAMLAGTVAGIAAYGALFLLISLLVPRALLVGIIYVLIWESALARFIPGIKLLSVRHFAQSVFVRILDNPAVRLDRALQFSSATIVLTVLVVAALALATWRLRQMNLP